jgi:hypothetical protein
LEVFYRLSLFTRCLVFRDGLWREGHRIFFGVAAVCGIYDPRSSSRDREFSVSTFAIHGGDYLGVLQPNYWSDTPIHKVEFILRIAGRRRKAAAGGEDVLPFPRLGK